MHEIINSKTALKTSEIIGKQFYIDGEFQKTELFSDHFLHGDNIIYEVMRLTEGVALFFEEHYKRLILSCSIIGKHLCFDAQNIKNIIQELALKNDIQNGNIKIILYPDGEKSKLIIHFMYAKYPLPIEYKNGVNTKVYFSERNRPNAKIYNAPWRKALEEFIYRNKLSEAILINKYNQITEASRSNLFFIKDDTVYSTPKNMVLQGITRQKTIELIAKSGLEYIEKNLRLKDLHIFDAILLSSTSKKLLPIKTVGELQFNPQNKVAQKLVNAFFELEKNYIKVNKN